MSNIEKLLGNSHEILVEKAKQIATGLGYDKVYTEFQLSFNERRYIVDVFAEKSSDNKKLIIECGGLSGNLLKRLIAINFLCDEFIWLPYYSSDIPFDNNVFEEYEKEVCILSERVSSLKEEMHILEKNKNGILTSLQSEVDSLNTEINKLKLYIEVLVNEKAKFVQEVDDLEKMTIIERKMTIKAPHEIGRLIRIIVNHANHNKISRSALLRYGHYKSNELEIYIQYAISAGKITRFVEGRQEFLRLN